MTEIEVGRVEEARPARGAGGTEGAATLATVVSALEDGEPLRAGEGFARCRLGIGLNKTRLVFGLCEGKTEQRTFQRCFGRRTARCSLGRT